MELDYRVIFDGTDLCEEFGAVLSKFEMEPPEPKVTKVEIPAGSDLDITEAVGPVAYGNGMHRFELVMSGDGLPDRLRALTTLVHGRMASYTHGCDPGYVYRGRWQVSQVERIAREAVKVTLSVDHHPWRTRRDTVDLNCTGVGYHELSGSREYLDVTLTLRQSAEVFVGTSIHATYGSGTHRLSSRMESDDTILVSAGDWWLYLDGTDMVINDEHSELQDTDLVLDSDFRRSGTNVLCTKEPLQHAIVSYTRRDI